MSTSLQRNAVKIDVLLNSPGVHDEVRIRKPYAELERYGFDCQINERPFRMNQCIRDNSIVVWQRPLPESRELMIQNFVWLSQRGCLLLVDIDDHPGLFDEKLKSKMISQEFANLSYCHGILTSNGYLANELRQYNPSVYSVDNCIGISDKLNLSKHIEKLGEEKEIRILIANQNREKEHQSLSNSLRRILERNNKIQLIIIADQRLSEKLPKDRVTSHPRLSYREYKEVLSKCHVALAPLHQSIENRCKTVIKWQECTSSSVVVIGGPELYGKTLSEDVGVWIENINEIEQVIEKLARDTELRIKILISARNHHEKNGWMHKDQVLWHGWLMKTLWKKRNEVDYYGKKRLARQMSKEEITKYGGDLFR